VVYVSDSGNGRIQKFVFQGLAVPTMSEWALAVLALLILVAGTLMLRLRVRQESIPTAPSRG
jgi:hypothetical protein